MTTGPTSVAGGLPSVAQGRLALVVGGGTMGAGIAQVLLGAGCRVVLAEVTPERAAAAADQVAAGLARAGDPGAAIRLETVVGLGADPGGPLGGAALAIEAVPEDAARKAEVLRAMEQVVGPGTVLASNTSSLSVSGLAAALAEPGRFCGMHFFNPVPRSALVEIVRAEATAAATVELARAWVRALGKEEIVVDDSPGFATSRLGLAVGLEAIRMLTEQVASAADIDRAMVLGYRYPIGPLRLTDLVGLDVRLAIAEHLAAALGERFTPPPLLRAKVAAGELGKKAGRGFFTWRATEAEREAGGRRTP